MQVCSLNVRGIGHKQKREQVFHWLRQQRASVYFLQETHLEHKFETEWLSEWGHEGFFSGTKSNSEGIGILFDKSFSFKVIKYVDLVPGRLQVIEISHNDREITFINIYGYNSDHTSLFEKLDTYINEFEDKNFIIGSDFNTVLNHELDKKHGISETHKKCRSFLNNFINTNELSDIWRIQHPNKKQYTWHSSHKPPIFCRLDFFLISNNLINMTKSTNIKTAYKTDHSIISLSIDLNNVPRGPGYFKLNNSLLLDPNYQNLIKTTIAESAIINTDSNPNTQWEVLKGNVRNATIKFATIKKCEETKKEKELNKQIENIEYQLQNCATLNNLDNLKQELDTKKSELLDIVDNKINGIIIRLKAQNIESNEKNTKLFSNLEKKRSESKIIRQLNVKGTIINKQPEILKHQQIFYENLYKKRDCLPSRYNFFNENINKLNNENKNLCEGLLSESECLAALREMKNNKSPGSDGLTTEFYKIFWNDLKQYYIKSINYSYQHETLTELQKQSIITLLPKTDKDTCFLENWRPISLLNVDYKIATKSIANRLKKVISSIISSSQTGFIKGRYIGENIRLLCEVIEFVNERKLPALLFFTDFEKAFDSINHDFMFNTLRHFGFGESMVNWVKLFYNGANSFVTNNGYLSSNFQIQRGVRQGCPLSPFLFIVCIELLSYEVSNNVHVKGINIGTDEIKKTLFADDATFLTDGTQKSFETLIDILDNYSLVSGLKLNIKNVIYYEQDP